MFGKVAAGWILVFLVYLGTLMASSLLYMVVTGRPVDVFRDQSGTFIGTCLLMIPYLAAGLYTSKWLAGRLRMAWWIGSVPAVMEKVLIYALGALFVSGDGSLDGVTALQFIRADMFPYFTPLYLFCTPLSIAVCMFAATMKKSARTLAS